MLGAGATKAWCPAAPLATQFFNMDRLGEADARRREFAALFRFVKRYFGELDTANVEDVATMLNAIIAEQPALRTEPPSEAMALRESLQSLIEHQLGVTYEQERKTSETGDAYKFVKCIEAEDTIVNYNWDCTLDRALKCLEERSMLDRQRAQLDKEYRLSGGVQFGHLGQYIKLHGSTNWKICTNRNCERHAFPEHLEPGERVRKTEFCRTCGSFQTWYLQEPTVFKDYSGHRLSKLLHNLAAESFRTCRRVVIFGMSVSDRDFRTQILLRLLRGNVPDQGQKVIDIIDPNYRQVAARVEALTTIRPSTFATLSDWIGWRSRNDWRATPCSNRHDARGGAESGEHRGDWIDSARCHEQEAKEEH